MDPTILPLTPPAIPDPSEPDFAMPEDAVAAVSSMTNAVDTDDMFDPMAG